MQVAESPLDVAQAPAGEKGCAPLCHTCTAHARPPHSTPPEGPPCQSHHQALCLSPQPCDLYPAGRAPSQSHAGDAGDVVSGRSSLEEQAAGQLAAEPPQSSRQEGREQEQQHMVWMDDDNSVDALPWDMGSWSGDSGEASPSEPPPPKQQLGEPVGQEVLMTALNRRVSTRGGAGRPR